MDALRIDREAMDAIMAHSRAAHPEECCGAIVARDERDVVHRFTNIQSRLHAEDPENNPRDGTRGYTPEPKELLAVLHAGEEPGARLVAFYHSHPINGSYFSEEDCARAMFGDEPAYPDVTYIVFSDARVEGEVRAFAWDDGAQEFVERELEVRQREAAPPPAVAHEANGVDESASVPARKTVAGAATKAPARTGGRKRAAAKKVAAGKRGVAKKPVAKERAAKKGVGKKGVAKKRVAKKRVANQSMARKSAGRKGAGKKRAARSTSARKTGKAGVGRKSAARKVTKKATPRKAAARKKTAARKKK